MSAGADTPRGLAPDPRSEDGFSLAEVVIAMMVLALGTLAVVQMFDASTRNAYRAEQSQVAINVAQREIEEIRNLDYSQVALSSTPGFVDDDNDPRQRVDGTRFDASNNGAMFEMVRNGGSLDDGGTVSGGQIASGPEDFQSGDINGTVYRYVVWRNDPSCSAVICAGSQDLKRVIVAVRLDDVAVSGNRPYLEVQSDFIDPEATLTSDLPTGDEVNVPQQFWLTDTTCDNDDRQPIVDTDPSPEGHSLHNTLGTCSGGMHTGSTPGAPDLLAIEPPPDPSPTDDSDPAVLDYATDLEPTSGLDDDAGLQLTRQSGGGCSYTGGSGGSQWQKVHRWATPRISVFPVSTFVMSGSATLELYMRSLGGATHPANVCTYLYRRTLEEDGVATDELVDSDSSLLTPQLADTWERYRFTLSFPSTTLEETERLVLAVSVERDGTPADTVQLIYDHPKYQSRLEVVTSTPLGE